MQEEALGALRRIMSGDDGTALKAAVFVLETAREVKVGSADARELVRQNKGSQTFDDLLLDTTSVGGSLEYERRCRELGIAP